ncbi:MAG: hypothetical protein D6681_00630, partial [Calditrichaeota bacterium]
MNPKAPGPPSGERPGFRLVSFPKEFERNFFEMLDKRYYSILLATFVILYGFAFYMSSKDWQLSEDELAALKKRVIEKVYDVKIITPEEQPEEEDIGIGEVASEEAPKEVSERGKERVEESQTQKV